MERGFLEKQFRLKDSNSNVRTEFVAGLTTFMTMAYILVVNPTILSEAGMDWGAVFTATILAAIIGTVSMALLANYPFALAPGMGLNAFFTYTVVLQMGHPWQYALTAVFIEGVIFLVLSLFNVREAIFDAIPMNLKKAVSAGIGLFIALIGLLNAGVVTTGKIIYDAAGAPIMLEGGLTIQLGNITQPGVLLTLIGILLTGILLALRVKGALLIGILATTLIGIPMGITHMPEKVASMPPSIAPVFFKMQWKDIFSPEMLLVVFSFLFVDVFDTVGTLVGVSSKAKMLDENGKLPKVKQALLADAIGTVGGAMLGTSTVTTFVESSAGVASGGRTGLTSIFTAAFFALALFLSPLFAIIPAQATAPVLVLVGLFMMSSVKDLDFDDMTEAIPAFLTIVMMPFAYSIADGIVFGMVSYTLLKLFTGRYKEVSWIMYALTVLFVLKFILL